MINKDNILIEKDLILIGGGHANLQVLKSFILKPLKGLRITLISNVYETPYSGMLPGFLENIYNLDDIFFDLYKICHQGQFRFIKSSVTGIKASQNLIEFKDRPPLHFNYLSINIGIGSNKSNIINSDRYALTLKPISQINYIEITKKLENKKVAIVGSGAAGIEVSLALKKRYKKIKILLFLGSKGLLPNYSNAVQNKIYRQLINSEIEVINQGRVIKITKNSVQTSSRKIIKIDKVILATEGAPPNWLKKTDLSLSKNGFIQTNTKLQTEGFKNIFAAGDIINFSNQNLVKSGVYAVKSSRTLEKNIRNFIMKKPLVDYRPQNFHLSIIGLSNEKALAYKYKFHSISKLAFKIKKFIDIKFINEFRTYNKVKTDPIMMDCKGCASKVDISTLKKSLPEDIINSCEDAALIPTTKTYVNTVDMISALVTDPFSLGKISANHAMSDVYAAKSKPLSASMILQLPKSSNKIYEEDIKQVYHGAKFVFDQNSCELSGGHTMIGKDENPIIGFSVVGKKYSKSKNIIKNGDRIFLTGKIGVGLIFAGINSNVISSQYLNDVMPQLEEGNLAIGKLFHKIKPLDATDITGYGLCNHLLNLKNRNKNIIGITIQKNNINLFKGVNICLKKNINSSFYEQNLSYSKNQISFIEDDILNRIFFDPQTVGGIAFIVSKKCSTRVAGILNKNNVVFNDIGFVDNTHNKLQVI